MTEPVAIDHGWRRLALSDVGSTNDVAMDRFRQGDPGKLWVTAERQTQGRGRRRREWRSPRGNFYGSALLVDPASMQHLSTLPLCVVLALHDAVSSLAPAGHERLAIKWPNDLLLDGAKVAGILLETSTDSEGSIGVVVGIGINCHHAPADVPFPTTTLASAIPDIDTETLFAALAREFEARLDQWNRGRDFGPIRDAWLERAATIGERIVARFPDHERHGVFEDLTADGRLVLRCDDGTTELISAADIFLGRARG